MFHTCSSQTHHSSGRSQGLPSRLYHVSCRDVNVFLFFFSLVLRSGGPELQHAGGAGELLRREQPVRELGEHDHHLLHQGLLLRQAGGGESGGESRPGASSTPRLRLEGFCGPLGTKGATGSSDPSDLNASEPRLATARTAETHEQGSFHTRRVCQSRCESTIPPSLTSALTACSQSQCECLLDQSKTIRNSGFY